MKIFMLRKKPVSGASPYAVLHKDRIYDVPDELGDQLLSEANVCRKVKDKGDTAPMYETTTLEEAQEQEVLQQTKKVRRKRG